MVRVRRGVHWGLVEWRGVTGGMTVTDINSAGWVISDKENNVIYGHGATVDDAWAEVVSGVRGDFGTDIDGNPLTEEQAFERHYKVHSATEALLARVTQDGGAISWDIVRRIACTPEEAEA